VGIEEGAERQGNESERVKEQACGREKEEKAM
jgi:hypothetical protein